MAPISCFSNINCGNNRQPGWMWWPAIWISTEGQTGFRCCWSWLSLYWERERELAGWLAGPKFALPNLCSSMMLEGPGQRWAGKLREREESVPPPCSTSRAELPAPATNITPAQHCPPNTGGYCLPVWLCNVLRGWRSVDLGINQIISLVGLQCVIAGQSGGMLGR